jgi:hypothetical protein
MKDIRPTRFLPGIAWFFIVLILICLPGRDFPSTNLFDKLNFDKWIHMGIFGLLALLFMWPVALSSMHKKNKLQYFLYIAIATCAWGLATEFIQRYLVTGRSFDLLDWAADSLGALVAFIYCVKRYARQPG